MKILTIHADFIEFEAKKKAFAAAEENIKEGKQRVNDCLVVFTAVEKRDEADVSAVVQRYAQEIKNVAQQVNAKNIVIYPYAHLSSQLSIPQVAEKVLKEAEQLLKEKFFVARAPFGWYKAFTISCKGHPLSELSREFGVEATTGNTAEKTVEKTVEKEAMATTAQLKREYKDEPFALNEEKLTERDKIKLTTAALFGLAAQKLFPKSKIAALGLNRDRAYIDQENKLNSQQRAQVLKEMEKLTKNKNLRFEEVSRSEDIKKISDYQKEILKDVGHSGKIYRLSNLGLSIPHYSSETVPSLFKENPFVEPNKVQAFHFIDSSSAYWKRNEKNKQMEHNFLSGWSSEEEKQQYLKEQEEAENRSHLKIGKEQGLFVVSDLVGAGMPLLAPKGTVIRNELINFLWDLHKMKGYQQVWTPHLAKEQLYKTSGHWEKFGDELFHVQGKEERFLMKPMNCPHHMQIFSSFSWSYRDLPVRFF